MLEIPRDGFSMGGPSMPGQPDPESRESKRFAFTFLLPAPACLHETSVNYSALVAAFLHTWQSQDLEARQLLLRSIPVVGIILSAVHLCMEGDKLLLVFRLAWGQPPTGGGSDG